MELLYDAGVCKSIGVSNFLERHLQDIEETCSVLPHVNQIEFNPYQYPQQLYQYCKSLNIQVEGYCPLAKGRVLQDPKLKDIALRYGVTPAQVLLRWSIQKQVICIPKSTNTKHLYENLGAFSFQLTETDMYLLDTFHVNLRSTWDPTYVP